MTSSRPDPRGPAAGHLLVVGLALVLGGGCRTADGPQHVRGEFAADHPELGTWTATPIACEDGQAYGFVGIVFRFALPASSPTAEAPPPPVGTASRTPTTQPEEIRLDLARNGDNVIELRYPDRDGTVRRVRERECAAITGSLNRREFDGGVVRVRGQGRLDCPAFRLRASFDVDGCLPRR